MQSISILTFNSSIKFFILVNRWWILSIVRSHMYFVKHKLTELVDILFCFKARKINNQIIIVCLKTDGGHILIFIFDIFSHAFVCLFELSVIYVLASPPGFVVWSFTKNVEQLLQKVNTLHVRQSLYGRNNSLFKTKYGYGTDLYIFCCYLESFEPHVVCENYVCVLATQL